VQTSVFDNTAITLSVSYWYPSSESSGASMTDRAFRAVKKARVDAKVELPHPMLDFNREAEPSASPSPDGSANPPVATAKDADTT